MCICFMCYIALALSKPCVNFHNPAASFGVPESSPSASHWDVLVLQEPGSLRIPTTLPGHPAQLQSLCHALHCKHDTCHTTCDPGQEEHQVTSFAWGLLRALCHPPEWGFTDGFLSFFFQGLSRACVFCVQHGSRRGILFQDFPCIFYGPA